MIPRAHVTAWRSRAPWPDDALVEQDLVLSRALVEMFRHPHVASSLAFRGGTALHKFVLLPAARFSEDIDLVQIEAGPIGPAMRALRASLDSWLGPPSTKQGADRVTLLYRFDSELAPPGRRRLKVEISTREHFSVLGLEASPFRVSGPWFRGEADVTIFAPDELLGTKLRALYQRKKGRDLFDLALALERPGVSPERVVRCFQEYLGHQGLAVTRAQFEANLADKAGDPAFGEDVRPLLAPGVPWDLDVALQAVSSQLLARLPGAPWKGGRG